MEASSGGGSSQPTMAQVDAELAAALAAAELLARRNAQHHIRDVPRFRIGVNVDKRSFHRFMLQRYRRMLEIRSMLFGGRPVTPPRVIGQETFHIVEIVGPCVIVLELLFREWDLYLVAFRPHGTGAWFMFQDEQLPEWFQQVLTIPYSCRYSRRIARVVLKRQCCEDIFYTLVNYTEKNRNVQSDQRERAITATILFFAEPGRERSSQELMEYILEYGEQELGDLLDKRIHAWSGLSRDTFRHEIQPKADPSHLKRAENLGYTVLYEKDGEQTYESWDVVGKNGDLLILKFDTKYALPVIVKQQKEAAKAAALWQPREEKLAEISSMLEAHISPQSDQTENWRQLKHCGQFPDFSNYLVFLLTRGEGRSFEVRQAAGLLLKNNLPLAFSSMPPSSLEYIKSGLLPFIGATNKAIRSTVGTVISVLFQIVRVAGWIELFKALEQCLESKNLNRVKGAMDAIYKICEQVPEELDIDSSGLFGPPINVFMPIFLKFFRSPRASVRILALGCINQFIVVKPSAMHVSMDQCIQGLLDLAEDPSADVRRLVCSAWVQLIKSWPAALAPHLANVTEFVLNAHKDPDNRVAVEACEFWIAYCNVDMPLGGLREFLPCLIPILVSNIVYDADDEYLCDAKDLKPCFHASRLHRSETKQSNDDTDAVSTWNLRKYSMTALSVLSSVFGDSIIPSLMPMIQQQISRKDDDAWKKREAAILSVGTIAEGCFTGSYPHLLQMVVPLLNDKCSHVRAITCWTLSQYSKHIVQDLVHANGREQFNEILMGLLEMMVDMNERVQEAACSALAMLVEEAAEELVPQLEIILQHLLSAHGKYQRRNLRTLGTLADAVGAKLNQTKYIDVFMPPLIKKLQQLPDSDRDLFPLLECFTSIAEAVGPGFSPFAQAVFERCINFIQSRQFAKVNPAGGGVSCNKELTVYSLDLLCGLTEGLGASIETLVTQSNLKDLLLQCCMDEVGDIRQSAMALLGELSKVCPTYLHPHLQEFLAVAAKQLNPRSVKDDVAVACNACWSIGELAMKHDKEISPAVEIVIKFLVPVLKKPREGLYKTLIENSAITLGRICWVCPDIAVSRMRQFLQTWCKALCTMRHDSAKEDAFHGLCAIVEADLSEAVGSLAEVCQACASLKEIRTEGLEDNVCRILKSLKRTAGAEAWEQCMSTLGETVVDKLERFRV